MKKQLFAALLAMLVMPLFAVAQEKKETPKKDAPKEATAEENPYRNTKKGDYAVYKVTTKVAGLAQEGTLTQTVVAKDDKEATIKVEGNVLGMESSQEVKIDLTKPYDPTKNANLPAGADVKSEKDGSGKEKIKVDGKDVESTWESHKMKIKLNGVEIDATTKTWQSKDVKLGMIKMEMTMEIMGNKVEMTMELSKSGEKKAD